MTSEQRTLKRALEKAGGLVSTNKEGMIKAVQFVGKRTKDKHLELLAGATQIEKLILSFTNISDAGLVHLAELNELRVLSLFRNEITNKGVKHLVGLQKLKQLNLESTNVNDMCVQSLTQLRALKKLSIDHDSITQRAEDQLQEALPECEIYR